MGYPIKQNYFKAMNYQHESLKTLTGQAVEYLKDKGRSESTISKYVWVWQQVGKFFQDNGITEFGKDAVLQYVRQKYGDKKISDLTHYQKSCVSQAFNLIQFMETGKMFETIEYVSKEKPVFEGEIGNLIVDFISFKRSLRIKEKTLDNYSLYLYGFQKYITGKGIVDPQNISPLVILSYCSDLSPGHLGARHLALCITRTFLRYAYDKKKTRTDLSLIVAHDNYKQQPKLPSLYSKEEVKKILATPDRSTSKGKRDYAILLLIIRLGLRASDVRNLSFGNLKWAMDMLSFEQCKTGERIELPLPPDVGNAIVDYLKYGRPETSGVHIFVEHTRPYSGLGEKAVSKIANNAICRSGIDIGYRRHGSHSLRHTMAGFLLEGKTPITVISEMLGHSSIQSTMCYLRVDVENLRQCALDVPIVDVGFYEQEGGVFYG